MAKRATPKARAGKLKVYVTPIGFHDAYVAAPSQAAALKAWGADADLFQRGVAGVVTDPEADRGPARGAGRSGDGAARDAGRASARGGEEKLTAGTRIIDRLGARFTVP